MWGKLVYYYRFKFEGKVKLLHLKNDDEQSSVCL